MKQKDFVSGPILGPLTGFALPILAALLLQAMYGAVDLLIVGQFGSSAGVSAVATGSNFMQSITGVVAGMSMGMTVLIGQRIGAGRREEAGRIVGAGICLFVVLGCVIMAAVICCARGICELLQTPPEALEQTVSYIRICAAGELLLVGYSLFGGIFRGIGDSRTPLLAVLIACVINIAGDLLLVGVLHWEAAGAAAATVFAQGVSLLISLMILRRRALPFTLHKADLRPDRQIWGEIIRMGSPIALQSGLVSCSFLCITAIVNHMGVIASAGVGVAEKLCTFIMLVAESFEHALSAFVAQNIGARRPDRARRALFCGMAVSFGIGAVTAYCSFFHGDVMAGWFAREPEVVAAAWDYLRSYSIDTMLTAVMFCFVGYFNGCGETRFVMAQGIIGAFCVRVPVSFLMSRLAHTSLFLVGLATPCSTAVQIVLCLWAYRRQRRTAKLTAEDTAV